MPAQKAGMPIIYLGLHSRTASISLPILPFCAQKHKRATCVPQVGVQYLFGLSAPKVYRAFVVTNKAGVSYTSFSPLLYLSIKRFFFCGTGCHLVFQPSAFLLGSRVLCAARTFLPGCPRR